MSDNISTDFSLEQSLELLSTLIEESQESRPVAQAPAARQLQTQLDLSLRKEGSSSGQLLDAARAYLHFNPDVSQPAFFKLLFSGLNKPALLGDWITSLSNATMHTYQVGPVATLMELELIKQWNALVGFEEGDGVMVSGGSQANLIGMMLARQKAVPNVKEQGLRGKTLVAYISDQAHYSALKAVNVLGIGSENLIAVDSDQEGRILPEALRQAIEDSLSKGHTPFFIGLTAGTTVTGAFDPVAPCAQIAREFDLWLHIDGAWGAPVLFSDSHKHLLADCELADSVAWDAHKLMNVPITAAVILVKQAGLLKQACSGGGSDYLFHHDENADFNLGQRSIQCGRRADALKVWMSWKAIGSQGFSDKIDALQSLKTYCVEQIQNLPQFEILANAPYLNVLFRYNPNSQLDESQLRQLNINICKQLMAEGVAYIDYANYKDRTGIRLILANGEATREDIDYMLANCQRVGDQIQSSSE